MLSISDSDVKDNYLRVLDRIHEACSRSERNPQTVHLVVVTKGQPPDAVRMAVTAGASILGENYAEEAVAKINILQFSGVDWHMIGHIQSRKANLVAANFSMVHSLDNFKLARRLNERCLEKKKILPVLLEVNVSGEERKSGFVAWNENSWSQLVPEVEQISLLTGLRLVGLMTMPPFFNDPEQTRPYFQKLRRLREFLNLKFPLMKFTELSMGTSVDFSTAIDEGATYVRVGQAILGPRPG